MSDLVLVAGMFCITLIIYVSIASYAYYKSIKLELKESNTSRITTRN
ncbi:hypothetical protein [Clostridium sp. HBUAS56017]|nr:hypothetical protein [Clostridium sp. HBUAS56017]